MKRTLALILFALGLPAQAGSLDGLLGAAIQALATPPQQAQPQQAPQRQAANGQPGPAGNLLQALLSGNISEEEERRLGGQIAGNVLGVAPLVRDEVLQRYVNRVGRWVALQGERPDLEWRFGVIESEDINAFAAPGGYILLTKGLYRKLNNEAELAGVLAHEIGHVIQKHHLKLLQQSQMVAGLGGLLGQAVMRQNQSQVVQNIIGNGAEIAARSLDKGAEHEADRIGIVLAARAGYDAYGLPTVLQEIGHLPAQDSRMALLYKTHPHPLDRFERLAEAVGDRLDTLEPGKQLEGRFYRLK